MKIEKESDNLFHCQLLKENNLFFSLVCYRNNDFTSHDTSRVSEFFDGFNNNIQLIDWMKARPKGNFRIREIEGDKDIIVVIPTADYNSEYAKNCRERIFKGLQIIFVESGQSNLFFNYAHNCNAGIKKAMEYDPTWIVLSNDDMVEIDRVQTLIDNLDAIFPKKKTIVFSQGRLNVGNIVPFGVNTNRRKLFMTIFNNYTRALIKFEQKFEIKFLVEGNKFPLKYLTKHRCSYRAISDFSILSADVFKEFPNFYDDTFVNGGEDIYASLNIYYAGINYRVINYLIDSIGGASIGSKGRMLKDILNLTYLNYLTKSQLESCL